MTASRIIVPLCGVFLSFAMRAEAQQPPPGYISQFWTGELMLNVCRGKDPGSVAQCLAYTKGAADLFSAVSAIPGSIGGYRVCIPGAVSAFQVRDVVVQYLEAHPVDRDTSAAYSVVRALSAAWPCR